LRAGTEALVIFSGPQAYITPSWYPAKREHGKVVPTWNYVVVQARGRSKVIDTPDWLLAQIGDLTTLQERKRASPWAVEDAAADFIAGQLKGIAGVENPDRPDRGEVEGEPESIGRHPRRRHCRPAGSGSELSDGRHHR